MKAIYIAGPFRGKNSWAVENNIRKAEEMMMAVAELGVAPVCPHTMTRFFDGTMTDEYWLESTLELLKRCDGIIMLPGWKDSHGSVAEHEYAEEAGIPIFYCLDDLQSWLGGDENCKLKTIQDAARDLLRRAEALSITDTIPVGIVRRILQIPEVLDGSHEPTKTTEGKSGL